MTEFLRILGELSFLVGIIFLCVFVMSYRANTRTDCETYNREIKKDPKLYRPLILGGILILVAIGFFCASLQAKTTIIDGHIYEYVEDAAPKDTVVVNGKIYVLKK